MNNTFREPRKSKYDLIDRIGYTQYLIYKHNRNTINKYNRIFGETHKREEDIKD